MLDTNKYTRADLVELFTIDPESTINLLTDKAVEAWYDVPSRLDTGIDESVVGMLTTLKRVPEDTTGFRIVTIPKWIRVEYMGDNVPECCLIVTDKHHETMDFNKHMNTPNILMAMWRFLLSRFVGVTFDEDANTTVARGCLLVNNNPPLAQLPRSSSMKGVDSAVFTVAGFMANAVELQPLVFVAYDDGTFQSFPLSSDTCVWSTLIQDADDFVVDKLSAQGRAVMVATDTMPGE